MSTPSALFLAHRARLEEAARRGPVVDLACGSGRHALAAAELGLRVLALDRDRERLSSLAATALSRALPLQGVRADLETGNGIPLETGTCGAILVFRFLFRPLAPAIERALRPGGLLLYETFTEQQRSLGRGPRRADFLLEPGELPRLFPHLEVIEFDEGMRAGPPAEVTARLAAIRR